MAKLTRFRPRSSVPTDTGVTTDTLLTAANITRRTARDAKELGNLGRYIQDETFKHWAPIRQREGGEAASSVTLETKAVEHQLVTAGETRIIREDNVILPDKYPRGSLSLFNDAYQRAMFGRYVAKADQNMRTTFTQLGNEFGDNPRGFADAAEAYTQAAIEVAPPGARVAMRENSDMLQSQILEGITTKKAQRDMANAVSAIEESLINATDDLRAALAAGVTTRRVMNGRSELNPELSAMVMKAWGFSKSIMDINGDHDAHAKRIENIQNSIVIAALSARVNNFPPTEEGEINFNEHVESFREGKSLVEIPVMMEDGSLNWIEKPSRQVYTETQLARITDLMQDRFSAQVKTHQAKENLANSNARVAFYTAQLKGDWDAASDAAGRMTPEAEAKFKLKLQDLIEAQDNEDRQRREAEQRRAMEESRLDAAFQVELNNKLRQAQKQEAELSYLENQHTNLRETIQSLGQSFNSQIGTEHLRMAEEWLETGNSLLYPLIKTALNAAAREVNKVVSQQNRYLDAVNDVWSKDPGEQVTPANQETAAAIMASQGIINSDDLMKPKVLDRLLVDIRQGGLHAKVPGTLLRDFMLNGIFQENSDPAVLDQMRKYYQAYNDSKIGKNALFDPSFVGRRSNVKKAVGFILDNVGSAMESADLFQRAREAMQDKPSEAIPISSIPGMPRAFGRALGTLLQEQKVDVTGPIRKEIQSVFEEMKQSDVNDIDDAVRTAYRTVIENRRLYPSKIQLGINKYFAGKLEIPDLVENSVRVTLGVSEGWFSDLANSELKKAHATLSTQEKLNWPEKPEIGKNVFISWDVNEGAYTAWTIDHDLGRASKLVKDGLQVAFDFKKEAADEKLIESGFTNRWDYTHKDGEDAGSTQMIVNNDDLTMITNALERDQSSFPFGSPEYIYRRNEMVRRARLRRHIWRPELNQYTQSMPPHMIEVVAEEVDRRVLARIDDTSVEID